MIAQIHEKRQFTFRGKTLDELKQLDIREFAKYLKSRERRSIMRHFDIIEKFLKKCEECERKERPIRTHDRDLIIVPKMIGLVIYVYNGQQFIQIRVTAEMLGHRLGEFSATRKQIKHGAPGVGATRSSSSLSVK